MNLKLFNISDKIVVVTGGLGQLGRQFTKVLLENNARVVILDLLVDNKNPGDTFQHYIKDDRLFLLNADITNKKSVESSLKKIVKKWESVPFGLINNAALDSPPDSSSEENGPFEKFPEFSWDRVMDVNVKGVLFACQVFGKAMADAGRGSIVNIGSTYGVVSPDQRIYEYMQKDGNDPFYKPVAYATSKSALVNLTRYISVYWAKNGVRVNLMALGGVFNNQNDQFIKGYCARVPMGRMADEDEYNGTVVYLMSDASSYMTGTTIMLDGGWTAW
jgi:NAD(P)-dependent dehydrogenase (short-subunit alcohol dehydrogenase family)